jgi:CheY-like chemotaxis protein
VPILALTANYSDETREQCLAAGMQAFLTKPVEATELWSAVARYLKRA